MTDAPASEFVLRLDDVTQRLDAHAAAGGSLGLTSADPDTGERWDEHQVWAHLAEFVTYWIEQAESLLSAGGDGTSFGRVKTNPARIAAIERDRSRPVEELAVRLRHDCDQLRAFLLRLSDSDWKRTGSHPTLGVMRMDAIVERFLVGHLEEHADQLDEVAAR